MNTTELSQEWRTTINSFIRSREPKLQNLAVLIENFCSVRKHKMGCNTVFVGEQEKRIGSRGEIIEFKRNMKFYEKDSDKKFFLFLVDPKGEKETTVPFSLTLSKFQSGNEQGIYIENIDGVKTAYQFTIRKNKILQFKPITLDNTLRFAYGNRDKQ
ncbi:MAG: hypothetical protein J6K39_04130 [Clostridia bacterium]|nr:hypothetical protein [Clostridia bacterium]